jgi:hypothetical protein
VWLVVVVMAGWLVAVAVAVVGFVVCFFFCV